MAVVIDEVSAEPVEPPAGRKGGGGEAGTEGQEQPPKPEELARALSQQHERYERVRAY